MQWICAHHAAEVVGPGHKDGIKTDDGVEKEARANLLKHISKTHADIFKFSRLPAIVEHVGMDKAIALLKEARVKLLYI